MSAGAVATGGGGMRSVLVVDDEAELIGYFAQALAERRWLVTVAVDGFEAMEKLREHGPFDLLVLDIGLPRMNGFEVARRIRAQTPNIPIVVSTGYSLGLTPTELGDLNIRKVLAKPYGLDALVAAAEEAVA